MKYRRKVKGNQRKLKIIDKKIRIKTDASAARGMALRKGLGPVRHIEVNQLWQQSKVINKELNVIKVKGAENLTDALTKHIDNSELEWHVNNTPQQIYEGRHKLNPTPGGRWPGPDNWPGTWAPPGL